MGDVRVGCVLEVKSGQSFVAERGRGLEPAASLSANRSLERMFWTYGFRGRPARALIEVICDLIDVSSVGGGTFDLGSATYDMTRIATGQLDAYVEPGPRMIDDVPSIRAEFERVGDGAVLNNSPYDLAAAAICLEECGAVVTDAYGESLAARPLLGSDHEFQMSCVAAANRRAPLRDLRRDRRGHRAAARHRLLTSTFPPLRTRSDHGGAVLQEVALGNKSLADYTHLAGRGLVDEIRELAESLEGKRVLHVSATAFGGGVSEILYTIVPLMRDVGLDAPWQVIMGREEFFNATKLLHNSLQGDPNTLTPSQWELFDHYNKMNAESLEGEWDVIIVHDPQPVGMRHNATDHAKNWIWRCHIDLSEPNPEPIERLLPLISEYDDHGLAPGAVRAQGARRPRRGADRAAGDRPALAEEHGALPR